MAENGTSTSSIQPDRRRSGQIAAPAPAVPYNGVSNGRSKAMMVPMSPKWRSDQIQVVSSGPS